MVCYPVRTDDRLLNHGNLFAYYGLSPRVPYLLIGKLQWIKSTLQTQFGKQNMNAAGYSRKFLEKEAFSSVWLLLAVTLCSEREVSLSLWQVSYDVEGDLTRLAWMIPNVLFEGWYQLCMEIICWTYLSLWLCLSHQHHPKASVALQYTTGSQNRLCMAYLCSKPPV